MNGASQPAKRLNRADLLRALKQLGGDALDTVAEYSGYVPPVRKKVQLILPSLFKNESKFFKHKITIEPAPSPQEHPQAAYYAITERKGSDLLPEPVSRKEISKPRWYQEAKRLNPDIMHLPSDEPPDKEPLVPWSRLWPVLQTLLSETKVTRQPNMPRIIRTIANGLLLQKIPRQMRRRWAASVQVLVDRPERTHLFNHDYNQLLYQLEKLRGGTGLDIQKILRQPGGNVQIVQGKTITIKQWKAPVAGNTVFVLSDLGLLDRTGMALRSWLRVGNLLRQAGCRTVVLVPLPERYLTPELIGLFDCVCWDRGSQLSPVRYVPPPDDSVETPIQKDASGAEQLLAWLSPAVRVEPALLRAVRHRLPLSEVDIGHEVAAWHHDDVVPTQLGFYYQKNSIKQYRQQFKAMADENPELAKIITRLIRNYHRHVFQTQRDEELLILEQLMKDNLDAEDREEIESARLAMCELIKASIEQKQEIPTLPSFLENLLDRQHEEVLSKNPCYQAIWAGRLDKQGVNSEVVIPDDWDMQTIMSFLESKTSKQQTYVLYQQGVRELKLTLSDQFQEKADGFKSGSMLAEFVTSSSCMLRQLTGTLGTSTNTLLPLNKIGQYVFTLEEQEKQKLHIGGEELTVERFTKPDWAILIANATAGLYMESVDNKGNVYRWYWHPPEWDATQGMLPGFWFYLPGSATTLKPDWATDAGRDRYGFYADAEIIGITQRFRWIEPNSFMMGSPEDEAGRYDNETQHQVILTQGYWLADTACTQELWQAVMGDNPSRFEGNNRPVEDVSWDDIGNFLEQINKLHPELKLRLPTEAEWENACRAGTDTAFNFGDEIGLGKANYRGTWEYESLDKWGKGALEQTAAVKSYPPNAWGLYEMHGNVWEWCSGWYDDYPSESVTDSQGPESGDGRVLRGGSWFIGGRLCRSAFRDHFVPSHRYGNSGFRLARGHELKPVRTVGAGQQPADRSATERAKAQAGDGLRSGGKEKGLLDSFKDFLKR
ncbi:formylglycine-generating enzyme family protein [Nitrosomonas sp.]|uniref:formylglycine-generating enzyme family protein n=1 Tax=Nitrosomonas sp. TaxID=42353 RepID=UPI001DDD361A|nr:formylglycine-generating enzyme family protein [Nitrosomonas sp.]MCB1949533.1 formylglycine-generating enzyme family protein [Nitrosomonas sp.]